MVIGVAWLNLFYQDFLNSIVDVVIEASVYLLDHFILFLLYFFSYLFTNYKEEREDRKKIKKIKKHWSPIRTSLILLERSWQNESNDKKNHK